MHERQNSPWSCSLGDALHPSLYVSDVQADNATWLAALTALPEWQPLLQPTLVLAPHPDDETLGAGALIATLRRHDVPVKVVAATDGENAYQIPLEERRELARRREAEQRDALAVLGVPADCIRRLHLTDSGLHLQEDNLTAMLMDAVEPGMHLIAPWIGDFHPDHEACARAAATVTSAKGLRLTSYFFWTWHNAQPALLKDLLVRRFVPDAAALAAKTSALQCHQSQLEHSSGQPILPESLLGPARWPFEILLPA